MVELATIIYSVLAFFVARYTFKWIVDPLRHIPSVGGPAAPILSFITVMNILRRGNEFVKGGYEKYSGACFKLALPTHWVVVVASREATSDIKRRPDSELSAIESLKDLFQMQYTLGEDLLENPWQIDVIQGKLTRNLDAIIPDLTDELQVALQDVIPSKGKDWVEADVAQVAAMLVTRMSNRVFVGLPLCREREFLDLAVGFSKDVGLDVALIHFFPKPLKPLLAWFGWAPRTVRRARPYLREMIGERKTKLKQYGKLWEDKPKDMVQWLLDEGLLRRSTDDQIILRILIVNLVANHTSSLSVQHALFDLAGFGEYIQPLRDEIEPIVAAEGLSKASLGKMRKLDSFLKESQRVNGVAQLSMFRKAMKDITLVNGTFLPRGTHVAVPSVATHRDDKVYADAGDFDPFRFARMREAEGEATAHQFTHTTSEWLAFGHGRHACPGRFFAVTILKIVLSHILLNYDIKMANGETRPENVYKALGILPPKNGTIHMRKRGVS